MPYIEQADRKPYTDVLDRLPRIIGPGELNFVLTTICLQYLEMGTTYGRLNDVIGALECCKLEVGRRSVAPYEDRKIQDNGDVFRLLGSLDL